MKKKEKNIVFLILAISLIIFGMTLFAYHLSDFINFRYFTNSNDYNFQTDKLGHFGDFIGGFLGTLLTGIATYLVYITYISQKQELELQRKLIAQQQFESTFFNMLSVHRELKNNLFTNNKLFWFTDEQISELNKHYSYEDNSSELFNEIIKNQEKIGVLVFKQIRQETINLYNNTKVEKQIYFYNTRDSINKLSVILFLKNKLEVFNKNIFINIYNIESEDYLKNVYKLIFDLYQDNIGHYCRNVYHILKYIRETEINELLGKEHKTYKNYADIFQSQLNVDEQFLLFYNFIYFKDEAEDKIFSTVSLVNQYTFFENIGIENLILKKHEEFYDFIIKGSDRKI